MMKLNTYLAPLLVIISLLILSSCKSLEMKGQFVSDEIIAEINNKKPNKRKVMRMIGSPTYIPDYTDNTWYYIQRSMSKRAWFKPNVHEQRIAKITFLGDKVSNAELISNIQNENITAHSDYTKTLGTEKTSIQKFVKNLGRFNKTTDGSARLKKKKKK